MWCVGLLYICRKNRGDFVWSVGPGFLLVSFSLSLGLIYHRYISGDEEDALAQLRRVCWRSGSVLRVLVSLEVVAAVPFYLDSPGLGGTSP